MANFLLQTFLMTYPRKNVNKNTPQIAHVPSTRIKEVTCRTQTPPRTSAQAGVRALCDHFDACHAEIMAPGYKENAVRNEFITPFFETLGRDVRNTALEPVQSVAIPTPIFTPKPFNPTFLSPINPGTSQKRNKPGGDPSLCLRADGVSWASEGGVLVSTPSLRLTSHAEDGSLAS